MALFDERTEEWKKVSRGAGIAWIVFYLLFLAYALASRSAKMSLRRSLTRHAAWESTRKLAVIC